MHFDLNADQAMSIAARRRSVRTPWMPLLSALLELAGGQGELIRHSDRSWASVTFSGTRHSVVIAFSGAAAIEAGEQFIAALPDHEFTIPRQLVADATVLRADHTVLPELRLEIEVQLLLLEEA